MHMGMSLSQGHRLEQRITQSLKQDLRLEIRQALRQLLKLIQSLKLGQRISIRHLHSFQKRIRYLDSADYRCVINRLSTDGGAKGLRELSEAFCGLNRHHQGFESLGRFGDHLAMRAKSLDDSERERESEHFGLGLRMALRLEMKLVQKHALFGPNPGGLDGTPENLTRLLDQYPQCDEAGNLRWILAGGWAVELLTGVNLRHHHDIDTLLLTQRPRFLDTDCINTDDYFGVISCTNGFVVKHCRQSAEWMHEGQRYFVTVLRPEFLFCSKFLKSPRDKDWDDVELLVTHFSKTWNMVLIKRLIDRNSCRFERGMELLGILRSRDPDSIIGSLRNFHG